MHNCEECKLILDDDVRFCPKCGRGLVPEYAPKSRDVAEVGALIASANLHCVKEEWDEATADATEALRLQPSNPEIASLLAAVHDQRGMLDKAAVWYQTALELDPNRPSDSARLRWIREEMAARAAQPRVPWPALARSRWIWAAASGVTVLLIITLVIALAARKSGPVRTSTSIRQPTSGAVKISGAPVNSTGQASTETAQPPASDLSGATSGPSALRTPAEFEIRTGVAKSDEVAKSGASVDDVIADPRTQAAVVTFSVPANVPLTRNAVLAAAGAVARAAFAAHQAISYVTVRCVVSTRGAGQSQIAFIGDAARGSIEALSQNPTPEDYGQAFANPWWNPQIR